MWVENLPDNLGLLSLLCPSTSCRIDNVVVHSVPLVSDMVIPPSMVDFSSADRPMQVRLLRKAKQSRQASAPRNGSRSGRRDPHVSREDVLGALTGISDLHQLFVFGLSGMLRDGALYEFERMVHAKGCELGNSLTRVSLDDFRPVFRCAWKDLCYPCSEVGTVRGDIGTLRGLARALGCSTDKAKRMMVFYEDTADLLLGLGFDVSSRLRVGLREVA